MSTPAIMQMVSEKRAALASQRREIELLEAELKGMEAILALIPQTPLPTGRPTAASEQSIGSVAPRLNGGRQPGAISNRWKRHLLTLDDGKMDFGLDDVIELISERENRIMRPSEVKRIFDKYIEQGHVIEENDRYSVPYTTVQKFKSSLRDAGDEVADEDEAASDNAKKEDTAAKTSIANDYDLDDDIPFPTPNPNQGKYDLDDDIPL